MRRDVLAADLDELCDRQLPWESLAGRSVLITGATGLVGGYLTEALLHWNTKSSRQIDVLAVVRDAGRADARFAGAPRRERLRVVEHDLATPLPRSLPADIVIHCASPAITAEFGVNPIGTYLPNVLGTHHLLEFAAAKGCESFLYVSSGAAQGDVSGFTDGANERSFGPVDPLDPYSCYAEAKRMGETMCAAWHRQAGVPAKIVRLGHTYGPGLRDGDSRSFSEFILAGAAGHDIALTGDGSTRRLFCYLADAVAAFLWIIAKGQPCEAYLAMDPASALTILELARLVAQESPSHISVRMPDAPAVTIAPAHDREIRIDASKLMALGWRPAITPAAGIRRTLAAHA